MLQAGYCNTSYRLAVESSHPLKHKRQGDIHAIPASHLGGVQLLQMLISLLTFWGDLVY